MPGTPTALMENIAAISGEFHSNTKKYQAFYDLRGEELGGFPAIWNLMAVAGQVFTHADRKWCKKHGYEVLHGRNIDMVEDQDGWIEAITEYVNGIYEIPYEFSAEMMLPALAKSAIEKHYVY